MKPYETIAIINSLKGKTDIVTVLEERTDETNGKYYIVNYKGVKCTAIFNWFTCNFYVDDVYGRIK